MVKVFALFSLAAVVPLWAHHSFAAEYDSKKPIDFKGTVTKVDLVWAWGDMMNALQVFPNIIGLLGLSGIVAKIAHDKLAPVPKPQ